MTGASQRAGSVPCCLITSCTWLRLARGTGGGAAARMVSPAELSPEINPPASAQGDEQGRDTDEPAPHDTIAPTGTRTPRDTVTSRHACDTPGCERRPKVPLKQPQSATQRRSPPDTRFPPKRPPGPGPPNTSSAGSSPKALPVAPAPWPPHGSLRAPPQRAPPPQPRGTPRARPPHSPRPRRRLPRRAAPRRPAPGHAPCKAPPPQAPPPSGKGLGAPAAWVTLAPYRPSHVDPGAGGLISCIAPAQPRRGNLRPPKQPQARQVEVAPEDALPQNLSGEPSPLAKETGGGLCPVCCSPPTMGYCSS
ncbi:proline-rich protein HaeIII subfamily 1-like [Caloenas nicobarica]|uniref:proline-rich protein HaeIII subfamily 1-like n=1 Tax=Caloenas nicobarica TaxID=187106 RepID=UPI0032B7C6FA